MPNEAIRSDVEEICSAKGLDINGLDPSKFELDNSAWKNHDVIICIDAKISDFMPKVPYGCSVVHWTTPKSDNIMDMFHFISEQVEALVQLVRGPSVTGATS